ncbi:MAG: T9SS type A sorting domain-containing protein [candidate division KSB1 bacterium]|nr:T9SS type A sorting domain-containing protein [candidate division KSB1 bacterium]
MLWTDPAYPDRDWKQAVAPLGFGAEFEGSATREQTTIYFRKHFEFNGPNEPLGLLLKFNSGAVAYINGTEVYRTNVASGELSADDPAYEQKTNNKIVTLSNDLVSTVMRSGENVLAVEVHTAGEDNPLLSMDARLFSSTTFYVDLNSEWLYDDSGQRPNDRTLGEILTVEEPDDSESKSLTVKDYDLKQNYPNPFNPVTTIEYHLPAAEHVKIEIIDMNGRRVSMLENGLKPAGAHRVSFDAGQLSSGIYFYRMRTQSHVQVRRMLLLK